MSDGAMGTPAGGGADAPLRLRTFGPLGLHGRVGPLTGAAAQRRRLALLAILAVAGARGVSRDKVVALLWPERDAERARHALAQLLYAMRRDLPAGAVAADGGTLRLDPERVASDVAEFERALERGELATAVDVYEAPFLDGFFLSDAPEFERWAEGERARLAERAAGALERLATTAAGAGDHAGAARWWQRLAALDPLNSRVALALMEALARAGDRAGAIRHARVHEALVREELDAAPDAAVGALADRLRDEPATPATAADAGVPRAREAATATVRSPAALAGTALSAPDDVTSMSAPDTAREVRAVAEEVAEEQDDMEHELDATEAGFRTSPWRLLTTSMRHAVPAALVGATIMPTRAARRGLAGLVGGAVVALGVVLWAVPRLGSGSPGAGRADIASASASSAVSAVSAAPPTSVAVLDLASLSGDPADARLADALTEELTSRLGQASALRVKSRSAVRQLRGTAVTDPAAVGRALQVRYVVEGSVRRGTDPRRVRVALRLVNAADGFQLWSDDYDVRVDDLLAVQDTIATEVAGRIERVASGERR